MSTEQPEQDKDVNLEIVAKCYNQIELAIMKAVKAGVFDLKEAHFLYECCVGIAETIKRCDILQKKLGHFMRQQEMIQRNNEQVPPTPANTPATTSQ